MMARVRQRLTHRPVVQALQVPPSVLRRPRFWEIDALRGVAIIMMVIYHLLWDLYFFAVLPTIALQVGFWRYFQRTTASLFLILVGVSLVVSYQRARHANGGQRTPFIKFFWRGAQIFGWGMVISLIVRLAGIGTIDFGVLHLIGFAIIAAYPFLEFRWLNIGLWALFYLTGTLLHPGLVNFPWLIWLGLEPLSYTYLDYFPIIPWFGVVLLGIGLGNLLYADNHRHWRMPDIGDWLPLRELQFLGRRSLTIYLVHQPVLFVVLLALLFVLGLVKFR